MGVDGRSSRFHDSIKPTQLEKFKVPKTHVSCQLPDFYTYLQSISKFIAKSWKSNYNTISYWYKNELGLSE